MRQSFQNGTAWIGLHSASRRAETIIPVPGLCCCVIPRWIPVLLQAPVCSEQHFWHSFAGMVSVQDWNKLNCWRILFNKSRDAGRHNQADVLRDEILRPSSGWPSGPPFGKKRKNSAKQPWGLRTWLCKPTNQAPSQWGSRLLLKLVLRVNTPESLESERKRFIKFHAALGILSNFSVIASYPPPYISWFKPFHVSKSSTSQRHLIFLNAEHLLRKTSPFGVSVVEHPKITTWKLLWL